MQNNQLYFLWDYALTKEKVKEIMNSNNDFSKIWLVSRILESANFKDVWEYISLKEAVNIFPKLKLKPQVKKAWINAFSAWGYQV